MISRAELIKRETFPKRNIGETAVCSQSSQARSLARLRYVDKVTKLNKPFVFWDFQNLEETLIYA